jgi:hypothetical protein
MIPLEGMMREILVGWSIVLLLLSYGAAADFQEGTGGNGITARSASTGVIITESGLRTPVQNAWAILGDPASFINSPHWRDLGVSKSGTSFQIKADHPPKGQPRPTQEYAGKHRVTRLA